MLVIVVFQIFESFEVWPQFFSKSEIIFETELLV